jgi:hypothetical protein
MTIKDLLAKSVEDLEAMDDKALLAYLDPFIKVVECIKPTRTGSIIDVSNIAGKPPKLDASNAGAFIAEMHKKMMARMGV